MKNFFEIVNPSLEDIVNLYKNNKNNVYIFFSNCSDALLSLEKIYTLLDHDIILSTEYYSADITESINNKNYHLIEINNEKNILCLGSFIYGDYSLNQILDVVMKEEKSKIYFLNNNEIKILK